MLNFGSSARKKLVVVLVIVGVVGLGIIIHTRVQATTPIEIFRASGGKVQYCMATAEWGVKGKPIWANVSPYHIGLGFRGLNTEPVIIYYLPDKNMYRIVGKVEVCYPNGTTEVVTDADIQASGPPQSTPRDRYPELRLIQLDR